MDNLHPNTEFFLLLHNCFQPAKNIQESEVFMNTKKIIQEFYDNYEANCDPFNARFVRKKMTELGYVQDFHGTEHKLTWLLKSR